MRSVKRVLAVLGEWARERRVWAGCEGAWRGVEGIGVRDDLSLGD